MSVQDYDDVMPLSFLDQVWKPDPSPKVSREVWMPITALAHWGCVKNRVRKCLKPGLPKSGFVQKFGFLRRYSDFRQESPNLWPRLFENEPK